MAQAVPFDRWCGLLLDPATLLNTGGYHAEGLPYEVLPRLVEIEATGSDINAVPALVGQQTPVSTLHLATRGRPESSARYRDVLAPVGLGRELRAVLRDRGRSWGALILFRETDAPDFTAAEMEAIAAVGPTIARAVRRCLLHSESQHRDAQWAPGLVLLRHRHGSMSIDVATRGARHWLQEIPDGVLQPSGLPVVVASLTQRALADGDGVAATRLRSRSGTWLTLTLEILERDEPDSDRLSLVIEPTRPHELASIIADAYGLTDRERSVARLVVSGHSNKQIAAVLWLSPHTVNDHLKNVYAKLGVTTRAELTARLFFDHYLPRQTAEVPVGGDGWFIDSPQNNGRSPQTD